MLQPRLRRNPILAELEERAGIYLPGSTVMLARERLTGDEAAAARSQWGDYVTDSSLQALALAMDASTPGAQPSLITTANAGVLSLMTTYVDPKLIEVILQPVRAAEIYGEERMGDWIDETAE